MADGGDTGRSGGTDRGGGTAPGDGTSPTGPAAPSGRTARDGEAPAAPRTPPPPGAPPGAPPADTPWLRLPRQVLALRRLLLSLCTVPLAVLVAGLVGWLAGPVWALFALLPLAVLACGWVLLARNWRSWGYRERADDLLLARGVLWRRETIVPYGRMQLVEVTSGPVERRFGLASVQLHTAAAASDARVPGLVPAEAERLRDRLTALGEARSAGL
ncbi:PH domain-containing protein [Streptomyces sp. NPDC088674]|uniref:PH domain-containing protein n=1 Tax=Streptomyces sp. NPDC088674 TaxID=3365869 RepID=UPI00382CF085